MLLTRNPLRHMIPLTHTHCTRLQHLIQSILTHCTTEPCTETDF